ncbi:MAG: hypothetical protein KF837_30725, partial [Labilithrix sp.]|nr:hypothetical protein [Labilithrix sp.]
MADPKHPVDPQKEIEIQVGELEERVDRLRAIYEQYFMGYEKLEPTVPRKDVDRRFAVLRKANIRNTALRFRFNVVTQKFNTYAMYWTRICRQIEEGTFKRHIQKANRRFGARSRMEDLSIDVDLGDFEVDLEDDDLDMDAVLAEANAAAEASKSTTTPAPAPARKDFGELDDDTLPPTTAPPTSAQPQHRVARHAVLPAGAKGRVLVKKSAPGAPGAAPHASADGEAPRSRMPSFTDEAPRSRMPSFTDEAPRSRMPSFTDEAPSSARARMPSVPDGIPPSVRPRLPSVPDGAPSTSVIRAASPHVHRSPPGVNRPAISPSAQSVRRVPAATPASPEEPHAYR